jgi:ribonucleoside-diphosphate reductase alpha chain
MKTYGSPASVPDRFRLPDERQSLTHRFKIADFKGYLTMGFYPDGRIGEIFIEAEKQGSTLSGMLGAFGRSVSIGLQYGIPIDHFTQSFKYLRFTPEGYTDNPNVRNASSIMDYIFKYLEHKLSNGYLDELRSAEEPTAETVSPIAVETAECPAEERQDTPDITPDDTSDTLYSETTSNSSPPQTEIAISCKSDS